MSARLILNFLVTPQLYLKEEPVTAERRKASALLAVLAMERGQQTRDSLSALLWPDYDPSKAVTNLHHTLWEVRQAIGEGWIIAECESMELNPEGDISLDVCDFESLFVLSPSGNTPSIRISLLAEAVKLYGNHFLTRFSLRDAPDLNEWVFTRSEDVRHKLSTALTMLSEDHRWN